MSAATEAARGSTRSAALRGFSSLANPQFRMLWFGLLFSQGAMQVNIVARSWLAYHVSGSGAALGIVAVASGLPMGLFSLIAGAIVDRADKRRILLVVTWLLAALAVATAVLVHLDIVEVWQLALVGLLQGVVFAFNFPTRQALVPTIVGEDDLPNAIAMNSTGLNLNRVVGPSIAGVLLAWHPAVAFDAIAVLYVISAVMLVRLPKVVTPARDGSPLRDMIEGFGYVRRSRPVLTLLLLALVPTLLGMPFQQFLPVFQENVLRVGPSSLGLMFTAVGVGSLAGSLAVAYIPPDRARLVQLGGGFLFGLSLIGFAFSTSLPVTLGMLALVGVSSQGYFVMNNVLLMGATDRRFYGRMMSIYMLTWSMMPVAVYPMGVLIDVIGMPLTQAAAGLGLALFVAVIFVLPKRFSQPEPERAEVPRGDQALDAAS